ncbi:MAG: pyridoxamine 5'-phosphate oxidase family protein [Prevotella sp.]|jgi:nitroimidazol reductase NimA-like FMN-containing flavoprotein (pyridoxamine 5'-phosphate oxidase superfamily)|nr:pyridoxamine 5'-phosphate oxidase family protein [Prevotella sp.]
MITIASEEKELIEDIILQSKVCFVGMADVQGFPYVLPMNFGYKDGVIYFHSAQTGSKITAIEAHPNVCITFCPDPKLVYQHEKVACSYRMKGGSVICRGKIVFVEEYAEKVEALNILMKRYSDRTFSYSAPAVHNVKIWKVVFTKASARIFGAPHPKPSRAGLLPE